MNSSEAKVFGVLRFADEHELLLSDVAKRAELGIMKTRSAVHGLKRQRLAVVKQLKPGQGGRCDVVVRLKR